MIVPLDPMDFPTPPGKLWFPFQPRPFGLFSRLSWGGGSPPLPFNFSFMAFIPKGDQDGDDKGICRSPEATRPISLKNSDNKIISGTMNKAVKYDIARQLSEAQRGFKVMAQLGDNILDIDSIGRIFSMLFPGAFYAFWDVKQAFTSVFHYWLHAVLGARGFPAGFRVLIESLYYLGFCYLNQQGMVHFLFVILSGILQGCPLSGSLFAISGEPFLLGLTKIDKAHGSLTRACADDHGQALPKLDVLKPVLAVFRRMTSLSGMELNPLKSVLVPLSRVLTPEYLWEISKRTHFYLLQRSLNKNGGGLCLSEPPKGTTTEKEKKQNEARPRAHATQDAKLHRLHPLPS